MKYFIPVVLFVVVGCGRGPVATAPTKPEETPATKAATPPTAKAVDDGMASAADLVKWKDDPASFVGKKLKVRAKYVNPFPNLPNYPLSSNKSGATFEKYVEYNGKTIKFLFSVNLTKIEKIPNAYPDEEFDIEFEVTSNEFTQGNIATSISR
jgi:hypothetical protein